MSEKNMSCYVTGNPTDGFRLVIQATNNNALNALVRQLNCLHLLPLDFDPSKSYLCLSLNPSLEGIQSWMSERAEDACENRELEEAGWR